MRVDQLWRYPVKSVGGERLTVATVGVFGIEGDRTIAVLDERERGHVGRRDPGLGPRC